MLRNPGRSTSDQVRTACDRLAQSWRPRARCDTLWNALWNHGWNPASFQMAAMRSPFQAGSEGAVHLRGGPPGDEAKNIHTLAAAAEGLPWRVRVAGAKTDPSGHLRLPENVEYCGRLSAADVADQMALASIYCLPARYEPFGLSVLEAALAGCALVLGDIPSLRENWKDAAVSSRQTTPPRFATLFRG